MKYELQKKVEQSKYQFENCQKCNYFVLAILSVKVLSQFFTNLFKLMSLCIFNVFIFCIERVKEYYF